MSKPRNLGKFTKDNYGKEFRIGEPGLKQKFKDENKEFMAEEKNKNIIQKTLKKTKK